MKKTKQYAPRNTNHGEAPCSDEMDDKFEDIGMCMDVLFGCENIVKHDFC